MSYIKFSLVTFLLLFSITFVDIILDWGEMQRFNPHILVELALGIISFVAFNVLFFAFLKQRKAIQDVTEDLTNTKEALSNADNQLKKLMGKFSLVIQKQFDEWKLTQSEKEVGLLLLKGLSLDEIASVRETKEKTVRQQASNLYKKAGLSGRHELVAFFFEDLLIH